MRINTIEVKELARLAFPDYNGQRFEVLPFEHPLTMTSYWDGGCREYWALVNLATNRVYNVPENGTPWTGKAFHCRKLPCGIAAVKLTQNRAPYIAIYLNPANIRQDMLPAPVELEWAEQVVLSATRGLKSSYAGIKNYRFHEARQQTGIEASQWEAAKSNLIARGMLNKAGAITDSGRNAIGTKQLFALKVGMIPA